MSPPLLIGHFCAMRRLKRDERRACGRCHREQKQKRGSRISYHLMVRSTELILEYEMHRINSNNHLYRFSWRIKFRNMVGNATSQRSKNLKRSETSLYVFSYSGIRSIIRTRPYYPLRIKCPYFNSKLILLDKMGSMLANHIAKFVIICQQRNSFQCLLVENLVKERGRTDNSRHVG